MQSFGVDVASDLVVRARPLPGRRARDRARCVHRVVLLRGGSRSPAAGCASTGSGLPVVQGDLRLRRRARRGWARRSTQDRDVDHGDGHRHAARHRPSTYRDLSDTVPTLAVVAAFADGPTTESPASGSSAAKETDRIAAVVDRAASLRRRGRRGTGRLRRSSRARRTAPWSQTYDDHRMAMSFACSVYGHRASRSRSPTASPRRSHASSTTLDQLR